MNSEPQKASLFVFGSVESWNEEVKKALLEELKTVEVLELSELPSRSGDLVSILCAPRDLGELRLLRSWTEKFPGPLSLVIQSPSFATIKKDLFEFELDAFKKTALILVLPERLSSRALALKLKLQFVKLEAAKKKIKKEDSDYWYRAQPIPGGKDTSLTVDKNASPLRDGPISKSDEALFEGPPILEKKGGHLAGSLHGNLSLQKDSRFASEANDGRLGRSEKQKDREIEKEEGARFDVSSLGQICPDLFLISTQAEDVTLASSLASSTRANLHVFREATPDVVRFLADNPKSVVLWDVNQTSLNSIGPLLSQVISPDRVFGISNLGVNQLSYLRASDRRAFTQTIFRRKNDSGAAIYSFIIRAILENQPFGLSSYFEIPGREQTIEIKHSSQRTKAVETIQNFLLKQGLHSRIARHVAQGADELLLNAILQAPITADGTRYRSHLKEDSDLVLNPRETIQISVRTDDDYFGVCVKDRFGSLKIQNVLSHLSKDFRKNSLDAKDPGIGLNRIMESGVSLLFAVKPGETSEVFLFFPNVKTYKDFKKRFGFVAAIVSQVKPAK